MATGSARFTHSVTSILNPWHRGILSKGTGRKLDFAERALRTVARALGERLDGTALDPPEQDQRNPHALAIGREVEGKLAPLEQRSCLLPSEEQ